MESLLVTDWITLQVLFVLFFATLIRSAFGFGEALIAVPLLTFIMPVEVAAPVAVLVSITVAGVIIIQDWNEVHTRSAGWLVLSSLPGIPLGLMLLTMVAGSIVKGVLAVVIIAFSAYSLKNSKPFDLKNDRWAWLFGFGAGVLGGAYGMNGPPLVVYGTLRGWTPSRFRATLQGYFLPASLVVMAGYWGAGLWTSDVNHYYVASLPIVISAIFAGKFLNRRMSNRRFLIYIHAGLIIVGVTLLMLAVYG